MKFTAIAAVIAAALPATLASCESGLNHNLGTSCHGKTSNSACSSADRSHILYCDPNGLWRVGATCPNGQGCHNCECHDGY